METFTRQTLVEPIAWHAFSAMFPQVLSASLVC